MSQSSHLQAVSKQELFPRLSGKDLLQLCQTNRAFAEACRDDRLWEGRSKREYPDWSQNETKPESMTWRQYYILMINSNPVTLYYNDTTTTFPSQLYSYQDFINMLGPDETLVVLDGKDIVSIYQQENGNPYDIDLNQITHLIFLSGEGKFTFTPEQAPARRTGLGRACHLQPFGDLANFLITRGFRITDPELGDEPWGVVTKLNLCRLVKALINLNLV